MGAKSLSKIGSAIGTPLVTDECTTNKLRVSYARILVEVDIKLNLATEVTLKERQGRILKQPIEYEWRPLFCETCQKMGHKCEPNKHKQWIPRGKPKETEVKQSEPNPVSPIKASTSTTRVEETQPEEWHTINKTKKVRVHNLW